MPWRLPDLVALSEGLGASDHAPRAKRRVRASLRHARLEAPARWLGFGRPRTVPRGLALELVAPVGDVVRADQRGVVRYVVRLTPGGVGLAIDHGAGTGSVWLQLARVRLHAGDAIEAGALLGVIGASSRARAWAPWRPPYVLFQRVYAGEAVAVEHVPEEHDAYVLDPAAVGDGIASCRDVRLRESLDALPTLDERAWALTFWRVAMPETFVREGRLRVPT